MGRRHAGGELELDEGWQRQDPETLAGDGYGGRVGKPDGLGSPVAGEVTREDDVDRVAVLGVPEALAARKLLDVTASQVVALEALEPVAREKDVDAGGQPLVAVRDERHRPRDRVRHPGGI